MNIHWMSHPSDHGLIWEGDTDDGFEVDVLPEGRRYVVTIYHQGRLKKDLGRHTSSGSAKLAAARYVKLERRRTQPARATTPKHATPTKHRVRMGHLRLAHRFTRDAPRNVTEKVALEIARWYGGLRHAGELAKVLRVAGMTDDRQIRQLIARVKRGPDPTKALGEGQGVGGVRQGVGGVGQCYCARCNQAFPHKRGIPCIKLPCPVCGAMMSPPVSARSQSLTKAVDKNTAVATLRRHGYTHIRYLPRRSTTAYPIFTALDSEGVRAYIRVSSRGTIRKYDSARNAMNDVLGVEVTKAVRDRPIFAYRVKARGDRIQLTKLIGRRIKPGYYFLTSAGSLTRYNGWPITDVRRTRGGYEVQVRSKRIFLTLGQMGMSWAVDRAGRKAIWRAISEPGGRTAQIAQVGRARAKVKHLPNRGYQVFVRRARDYTMRRLGYPMTSERSAKRAAERWLSSQRRYQIRL